MPIANSPSLNQASIYTDLSSLDKIRRQGQVDELGAIKKAAQEFEAFFMNMMLKSMREASDVIGSDSPFSSQQEKMFTGMLDEQMSVNLSQEGHLRIADLMVEQLSRLTHHAKNTDDLSVHLKHIKSENNNIVSPISSFDKKDQTTISDNNINLYQGNEKKLNQVEHKSAILQNKSLFNDNKKVTTQPVDSILVKPQKRALFSQISDFVKELMPFAKKAAQKLRLDPGVLIAQAALETGWGKFVMHDDKGQPGFNLFGIKAGSDWQGESIKIDTLEVENQAVKKVNANFRKYQDFAESFEDYVNFVTSSPRYESALKAAPLAKDYLSELQSSGYATDPQYAEKILRIFEDHKLQDFEPSTE